MHEKKWQRITLTKAAQGTTLGLQLIDILTRLLADGALQDSEVAELRAWAAAAKATELPSLACLRETVETILADGIITQEERIELVTLMLRILPAEDRAAVKSQVEAVQEADAAGLREEADRAKAEAKAAREEAARARKAASEERAKQREAHWRRPWQEHAATGAQIDYLKALGFVPPPGMTKGEASAKIDDLLNSSSGVSNRQKMVLRFWSCEHIAEHGKREVSLWMDVFYREDPDRIAAWEWWKEANGDFGSRDVDPLTVPVGAGHGWFLRVKQRRVISVLRRRASRPH